MLPWQKAQKHQDDYQETLETTCTVTNGFVQRYNGKAFWDKFSSLGHDKIDPKLCKCGAGEHWTPTKRT